MNRWPKIPLGGVCFAKSGNSKIIKGTLSTVNDGNLFPAYSATGQDVFSDGFDFEGDGIIISAVGARCGKCFLANGKWRAIANTHVILPKSEKVNVRFLWYLLNDESFWVKGGTAQPFVKVLDSLKKLIAVPPLAEQERIVKLLDEVDELRKLRAQADRRTADLIPALFHEMFGDPITNSKRWFLRLFSDVGTLDRGRSKNRPRDEASLYGGKYPFIQTGDVANANGEITAYTQTYSDKGLAQSKMWPAGTLCITIAANIGKTAILTFPACFPDSIVGFIPGKNIVVDYVRQWLVTIESRLEEAAPQMAQKNINLKILSELEIPVPPLPLQKEFAQRVAEIREMEAAQSVSRKRLDDLFNSMLHRAFEGEL